MSDFECNRMLKYNTLISSICLLKSLSTNDNIRRFKWLKTDSYVAQKLSLENCMHMNSIKLTLPLLNVTKTWFGLITLRTDCAKYFCVILDIICIRIKTLIAYLLRQ
jgi:hypothetical protein